MECLKDANRDGILQFGLPQRMCGTSQTLYGNSPLLPTKHTAWSNSELLWREAVPIGRTSAEFLPEP